MKVLACERKHQVDVCGDRGECGESGVKQAWHLGVLRWLSIH